MVERINQRQWANVHELQWKYGPDGKHFSTLGEPQMFPAIEHCGRQLL